MIPNTYLSPEKFYRDRDSKTNPSVKLQLSQRGEITKKKYMGATAARGLHGQTSLLLVLSLSPLPVVRRACAQIQFVCEEQNKSSGEEGRRTQT
jgi:hypothetical protein